MEHVSGGWGIVRADWVNHPEVGPDELALLALLSLYAGKDGACWPSQSTLADRLKRSRSWVIRVLNNLEAAGLVTRSQRRAVRGRRATCLYTLVGHAEAVTGTPLTRSDLAAHDRHVAGRRVAGMEQEHQNPAIAGLSHDPHEGSASLSENEQVARTYQGSIRSEPPEDWTPSPADQAFATEHAPGVDVHRFARLFVESCRSHGYRYVNHSAAFRTWLLNCWEKPDAAHAACRTNHQHSQRNYPPARHQPGAVRSSANRDTTLAALDLLADGHAGCSHTVSRSGNCPE
jgi:DNA-binding MarR family transcriptional regulator